MDTVSIIIRRAARRWAEKRLAKPSSGQERTETAITETTADKATIPVEAATADKAAPEQTETAALPAGDRKAVKEASRNNQGLRKTKASGEHTATAKECRHSQTEYTTEELLQDFLTTRYRFRYNVLTEVTEYAPAQMADGGGPNTADFRPVNVRALNTFCIAAHRAGIPCWDRDMARLVNSASVPDHHPFTAYFDRLPAWDGKDRIGALAARVSDSGFWKRHFHRWLLAVVAQWTGRDRLHANSVAPLLVSMAQGMGKSAFCRALLPPELRAYYSDCVDLNAPESVGRKLTELGLLNLDEFDRIGPKRQPQLKNLMQLSSMNLRKAYSRHAGARRRIASFIGTSNSRELLTDPSGSRRFICVEVQRPIDCTGIEHDMIFAQLKEELARGERYWFNADEEAELQAHNMDFYRINPTEDIIRRRFRIPAPGETPVLMALEEVMELIRKGNRYALRGVSTQAFARALLAAGFTRRHTREGNRYEVAVRKT